MGSKLIRVLLAVTLVVGLMPSTSWAAQPSTQVDDVSPSPAIVQPTDQAVDTPVAAEAEKGEAIDPSKTAESVTPSDDKALTGKDAADAVVAEKETTKEESAPKVLSAQTSWSNPLYNDDVVTGYVGPSLAYDYHGDVPYFGSDVYGDGYEYLHNALVNRQSTITLEVLFEESITTGDQMGQKAHDFFDEMKAEFKDDYLEFNLAGWEANISGQLYPDYAWLTITYNVRYNTTLEQEQYVTSRINELYYEIDPYSYDSDYDRVKAIHDWICLNVHYDHANLNDSSYRLKYSAYAALHDGYAVCQGYALLFYRMCKEWGLDARIISGTGNGGPHGWNIVRVDGDYYNIDPTWDENYTSGVGYLRYDFFLKSDDDFGDHQRDEKYWTQEYEVSPYSYGEWPEEPQVEATEISLNKEVPVQLQNDPYGEFKTAAVSFTAPYSGSFDFVTNGEVYSLKNVETDSWFSSSRVGDYTYFNSYMAEGETRTFSFEIDTYRDEISFGVYDARDIGRNPTYEYDTRMETMYEYDSYPILATVSNFHKRNSWGWDYLYNESEYTRSYLNADGSELTDTDFAAGEYILRITGIGDYFGSFDVPFTVYPLSDLRAYQIYVENLVIRDGQPMWDPQVNVNSRYDEANDQYINLEYGEDYYIAGYEDAQGNRLSSFDRDVETYIVIAAYPGGKVSGEQRLRVWLNDADYLYSWRMTLSANSFSSYRTYIGGSADDVKVYLGGGYGDQRINLVEGVDYTVSWYEQFSEDELPGVPTESGVYAVEVTGMGVYGGSTMRDEYITLTYVSATDVQLDQMTEFSMQSGDDDRYFIFTAPEAGTYRFRFETADLNQWGGSPISLGEYAYGPDFDSWSWSNGGSSTTRRDGDKVVQSGTSGEFELSEGQQVCISTEIHSEEGQATAYIKAIRSNDLDSDAFSIHSGRDNVALSEIESVLNSAYVETHDENWNWYQLQRGVDFQLSWKTLDGEAIAVPQEEGEYYIVVTGINQYCGERLVRIAVTDPYNLDYYSMRPQGLMYDSQIGYVLWRPMATNVRVSLDGSRWLSQDRDFTLETIDNGDSVTVVARGISPYYGTKELTVPVVEKVSMSQASQYFSWRINHTYLSLNPYSLQSVPYTGAYIPMNIGPMPYGELGQADSRYVPIRDVDFQVRCYRVVDGEEIPVIAPKEIGDYRIELEALGGSLVAGTTASFNCTVTGVNNIQFGPSSTSVQNPYMTGHFLEQVSNEQGYPTYLDGYTVETNRGDTWNLVSSIFGPLVQGVDYVMHFFNAVSGEEIEPTSDAVQQAGSDGNIIRVVFQGIGRFAGSIQRMFKLDNSANEDVFARLYLGQGVYRAYGTVFTDGAAPDGKGKTEVWVDQDGQIVDADILVVTKGLYGEDMSRGVDYSDVYIIDEQGQPISYVVEGPQVVEIVGMGDFAGLTKRIDVIAHDASSLTDISKANFVLRDGFSSLGDNSYGVLRGRAMNATVWVAAENGQELVEGTDFTLTRAIEGDQLVLTATAVPGSGFTGSKTLSVEIAPLDISRYASVNFDGWESNFTYQSGTPVISNITSAAVTMKASPMQISVYDYGYARDTRTRLTRGVDYQISIADVDGNAVDTITRVGRYVVTLNGMGEWTGSASFDLRVEAYAGNYTDGRNIAEDSSYSLVADYNAEGLAVVASANSRPEFRLVVGGVILNEGTDYTLSYSMPDPLGYAHVTAVGTGTEDDGYYGQLMVPYKVEQKANLAEMVLMFQVEKNGVIGWTNANGNRRITVDLVDGVAQPVVCVGASQGGRTTAARYDFSCIPNRVDPSAYDVEFGNNTEPGQIAWVKVTPKAGSGYVGTLSANFMVAGAAEPEGPADISQATLSVDDQTYTGSALTPTVKVMYKGKVVDPSNYTVQYAKNTQIGTATVTVTGTGDFTGVATTTFRIDPANINDAVVSELAHFTYTGEEITPEPRVSMNGKLLKLGVDYTLDYEDNIDAGTGSVFINGKGNYTDTTVAEFVIEPADISEALFDEIYEIYTGSAVEPDPIVMYNWTVLERDVDYTLSYSNNVEVGTATVTATGMGNFTGSISTEFSIAPRSLDYAYIELIDDQVYTGEEIQPEPIVTVGDKTLVADEDYIFFYFNHIDVGVATVVIQGMGNYEGEMYLDFNIVPASIEDVTIPDIAPAEYTGSAITPKITLSFGDIELVQGIDFTTSFTNNVNAGTATVGIEGMNNFEGTVYKSFTITPKSLADASIAPIEAIYTGQPVTPEPAVTLGGKTLVKDVDYTLSYSNNDNIGVATLTVTGKGNYAGTVSCEFTIAPKTLSGATVAPIPAQTYTGDAITPVVAVTLEGKQLVKDVDYTLSYSNNVNAGTATMTVLGKGEYSGSVSAEFKINPATLNGATIALPQSLEYTGTALTPAPTVTLNGKMLVKDVDYTVAYTNNVKVGTATVTVTGKGNYTGIGSKTFAIVGKSIASAKVVLGAEFEFTGAAITPEPTVTVGGKTLVKGTDYTVSYANNVNTGTATVTITGKGNYAGTAEATFDIVPQTLSSAVMAPVYDAVYTGEAITPEPAITLGGKTLVKDVDYVLSYDNNVKAGRATVTATGIGNYGGVVGGSFIIWYEATYELNGGENDGDNRTQFVDPHQLANPYKAGYEFAGWFTDSEFAAESQVTTLADGNFTVYAKWEAIEYAITYNLKGGKNGKNPETYTVETDTFKLANATRSGFSFKGWFYDEACTQKATQVLQGTYGDITLYAQWSVSIAKNMQATYNKPNVAPQVVTSTETNCGDAGSCMMVATQPGVAATKFPIVGNRTAFRIETKNGYELKTFNVTYTDEDGNQVKLTNGKGLTRVGAYSPTANTYEFEVPDASDVSVNVTWEKTQVAIAKNLTWPAGSTTASSCAGGTCTMVATQSGIPATMYPLAGNMTAFKVTNKAGYKVSAFNVTYTDKDGKQVKMTTNNGLLTRVGAYSPTANTYEFKVPNAKDICVNVTWVKA